MRPSGAELLATSTGGICRSKQYFHTVSSACRTGCIVGQKW
jgi:hypothetical protein